MHLFFTLILASAPSLHPLPTHTLHTEQGQEYSPYLAPVRGEASRDSSTSQNDTIAIASVPVILELVRRQSSNLDTCPKNYNPCSALPSAAGVCCTSTAICALDNAGHIACCPTGSACTGTISVNIQSSSTSTTSLSQLFLGGTSSTAPPTSSSSAASAPTNGLFLPATTVPVTSNASPTPAPSPTSFVPNAYFAFPVIATTFPNAPVCSAAYSNCQSQYTKCASSLESAPPGPQTVNGVTVAPNDGSGAGITVIGGITTLGPSQATSICQSLSSQACHGLILTSCSAFGGVAGAAPTACAVAKLRVGVGMGIAMGIAGGVFG